ncbi:hypothetical protein [Nocardioides daphniae]|uniref:Apolipoprotein N-acyltransferase N-terminal domain-containing protein n=1 Tax=Nocardioides daphniae TaxID=402297 RepID=A0A4P7UAY9_9ACTN|nr:hypothetical protein [Nocardioides daphniae]QCC76079.1 hypothetical protein E2C04_00685 [Nocardioides daphniae]
MSRELPALPLALGGGLAAAASFEPYGCGWLAPLAMTMLWLAVRGSSWRAALLRGACFGAAFMGVLLWWLVDSIGWVAWALLASTQGVAVAVAAVGVSAVSRLPGGPVWAGAAWSLVETIRSAWPLGGMPWGRWGVTALETPWEDLLPYAGISGTGFVVATAGFALGGMVGRRRGGSAAVMVGLVAAVAATTAVPYVAPTQGTFRIAACVGWRAG